MHGLIQTLLLRCMVVLIAFFFGYISIGLTIPTYVYLPIISLNMGLCVGLAFLYGARFMPCVFLGLFLVYHLYTPDETMFLYANAIYTLSITCCGYFIGWLLKRTKPTINLLVNKSTILCFFFLGAVSLGSLSSLFLSTFFLAINLITPTDLTDYILIHAIANCLGILLITPLIWIFFSHSHTITQRRKRFCLATSLILFSILAGVYLSILSFEQKQIRSHFSDTIDASLEVFNNRINVLNLFAKNIEGFMHNSDEVLPSEFNDFNRILLKEYPEILHIAWSPITNKNEINTLPPSPSTFFEKSLSHILTTRNVSTASPSTLLTPALLYASSSAYSPPPLGFLTLQNEKHARAFYASIKNKKSLLTHDAYKDYYSQRTMTLYVPYNKVSSASPPLSHHHFDGIISITLDLKVLFHTLFAKNTSSNISTTIFNMAEHGRDDIIYNNTNILAPTHAPFPHFIHERITRDLTFDQHVLEARFSHSTWTSPFQQQFYHSLILTFTMICFIIMSQLFFLVSSAHADSLLHSEVQRANENIAQRMELEQLLNNMDERIWIKDSKNTIVMLNQKAAEARNGSIDTLQGKNCYDMFPASAERYHQEDLEIIKSGQAIKNYVESYTTAEGKTGWMEVNKIPYCNIHRKETLLFISARDITDQKKEQDLLRKIYIVTQNDSLTSNEKITSILQHTVKTMEVDIGIISFLEEDHYVVKHIYSSIEPFFTVGQRFDLTGDFIHDGNQLDINTTPFLQHAALNYTLGMPLFTGNRFFGTMHFFRKDDTPISISPKIRATIQLVAQFIGHELNLSRYISELEILSDNLVTSNEELENFARVLAHDLKTPTRMLRQFMDLIEYDITMERYDNIIDYFSRIKRATHNMDSLVNALTEHTKLDGEVNFSFEPCHELLNIAIENVSLLQEQSKAVININSLPKTIYANKALITQLLENLISNSIKYCEEDFPIITISAEQDSTETTFHIEDNGIGVRQEHREVIFERFKRLHNTTKYLGTGLGLATCKQIVMRHGGKIWCEGAENGGSIFSFTLKNDSIEKTLKKPLKKKLVVQKDNKGLFSSGV